MTTEGTVAEIHYPDTGCKVATEKLGRQSRCLECPFPACIEDGTQTRYRFEKGNRNSSVRADSERGLPIPVLMAKYRLSKRSIWRIIDAEQKRRERDAEIRRLFKRLGVIQLVADVMHLDRNTVSAVIRGTKS